MSANKQTLWCASLCAKFCLFLIRMNQNILNNLVPDSKVVQRSVNIDSRDRNKTAYPDTNDYVVQLKDALFGVKRVELISAELPKSEYFIDDSNNLMQILIDPVLFANRAPDNSDERMLSFVHPQNHNVTILRIDSSQADSHGIIENLGLSNIGSGEIQRGVRSVFNTSKTSHLDAQILLESLTEILFVTCYSEEEDNFSGNCRFMIFRQRENESSFSFGSEFKFDAFSTFDKRLCILKENKFALVYNRKNESVNLLVGSVGNHLSDLDARQSNSNLINSNVTVYSSCRLNSSTAFVVFCSGTQIRAKLITIDTDFALYLRSEIQIDEKASMRLSCDSMNNRILVSSVDVHGQMHVYVLLVVDGPQLILLSSTAYNLDASRSSMNTGKNSSFEIDTNCVAKWSVDVFEVIEVKVKRENGSILLSLSSGTTPFPTLNLHSNEYYRFNFIRHDLDPDLPSSILQSIKIFTSQTRNLEYTNIKRSISSFILFIDESINFLYYGIDDQLTRGTINIVESSTNYALPFTIFASGVADVGNKPFSFKNSSMSERSLRKIFECPGENQASGATVSVNGTGLFIHENSEIWSFFNGNWTLVYPATVGTSAPGPRTGAMVASVGNRIFLFGGVSTLRSTHGLGVYKTPNFSIVPAATNSYSLRNIRNTDQSITFYDITTGNNKLEFASLIGTTGWTGLVDVSQFFEKQTLGFPVTSLRAEKISHTNNLVANPTGGKYTFSLLVHPKFNSVDTSGLLRTGDQNARITLQIFDGDEAKDSKDFDVALNIWTNIGLEFDTAIWTSSNLKNMKIEVTCSNVFMQYGFCAIREPELFISELICGTGDLLVELFFDSVKQSPKISRFTLEAQTCELEHQFMNDLWSMVVDPLFSLLSFSLKLENGILIDRCNRTIPTISTDRVSSFFTSSVAENVTQGPSLFSDGPSLMFTGNSVFNLPGAGAALRANKTNDFTFSCVLQPRLSKLILNVESTSNSLVFTGLQPSFTSFSGNVSNSIPNVYESGTSLVLNQGVRLDFDTLLPSQFIINAFVFIPSSASGIIPLFKIGQLQLFALNDSIQVDSMSVSFPRNQWFHVSWIGNGMAMKLVVDGTSVTDLVARDTVAYFGIGGGGWNGTVLTTGINVCTSFGSKGIDFLTLLGQDHQNGCKVSNIYTVFSTGVSSNSLKLFFDCSGTAPLLCASLFSNETHLTFDDNDPLEICFGRENGIIRLMTTSREANIEAPVSTALLPGDVLIGGQRSFNSLVRDTFCGMMDDIKLLLGSFNEESLIYVRETNDNSLRTRSMIWKHQNYTSHTSNSFDLLGRAGGTLSADSSTQPNLWIFGGKNINGSANDLWQLTTSTFLAYNVSGSPLSTGLITSDIPGSRSEFASYNDGENLYIFGGETDASVGPFQFSGNLIKLSNQMEGEESVVFWEGDASVKLYPVFTKKSAVLLDSSQVVSAEVSDGIQTFNIFLFPEDDQATLGLNAFTRLNSSDELQDLNYNLHVEVRDADIHSDFWKYSINLGSWELLNQGLPLRSVSQSNPSPGARSKCHLHYDHETTKFYLLPTHSSQYKGQDLWVIDEATNWTWKLSREYTDSEHPQLTPIPENYSHNCFPGSAPALYWQDQDGLPNLLTTTGRVFTNQLTGRIQEENLHHCIAINGSFQNDLENGSFVEFINRITLQNSSIFPGILDAESTTAMGSGSFLITTPSKLIFAQMSQPSTAYDPSQLNNSATEVIQTLPSTSTTLELLRGIKYVFPGIDSTQINIDSIQELDGVSVVAQENFNITIGTTQINFLVKEFPTTNAASAEVPELLTTHSTKITDLITSSAFSNFDTMIVPELTGGTSAKLRFSYQNQLNNRFGEISTIDFDKKSGFFSLINNTVFSNTNPTSNIKSSNALFDRTALVFLTEDGVSSLMCTNDETSPICLQSEVRASNLNITLLNDLEINPSNATWLVFFLYNDNLRVCGQKSTSNQLNAPVQNLVGETIRYSESFLLQNVKSDKVRICRLESGILNGEVVTIYSDDTDNLFFKDAIVSVCDPLNESTPPTQATETFSLVSQVNLVTTDFSDYEVISISEISSTNFIVVFLSKDRLKVHYKIFVREVGTYLSEEKLLFTFNEPVRLSKLTKSNDTFDMHFTSDQKVIILFCILQVAVDPTGSLIIPISIINQVIDNNDKIKKASSIFLESDHHHHIVTFSVHENTTSQVCPITTRVLLQSKQEIIDMYQIDQQLINQTLIRTSFKARLTSGDYNVASLFVDEIRSKLQTIDENFDCLYDEATTKISITNEFSSFILLLSDQRLIIEDKSASNGLGYILGFRDFKDVVSQFDGTRNRIDSTNRIDLFGRQYLYLFLSTPDGPISSEITTRNKEKSFGRIILSVKKGETMFFTSNIYEIFADVSIPVMTQLRIRLARFSQVDTQMNDGRDVFLYQPQGMEHSFSLKVHCALDKVGSGQALTLLKTLPTLNDESDDDDNDNFYD